MAGFAITNSITLRNCYRDNRALVINSNRKEKTKGELSFADSMALRRSIAKLRDYDYENSTDDDLKEKLTAYIDAYNNTLDTSKNSGTADVKQAAKSLKNLTQNNKEKLKEYGITVKNDGYLSLSDSAVSNISHKKFEKVFGAESDYMNDVYKYAKRINSRVDIYL